MISVGDKRFYDKCQLELFEKRKDRAMIMVSHQMQNIKKHCDKACVLVKGHLHHFDSIAERNTKTLQSKVKTLLRNDIELFMKKNSPTLLVCTLILSGCTSSSSMYKYLPSSGASNTQIENAATKQNASSIHLIDITNTVVQRLMAAQRKQSFARFLPQTASNIHDIGAGDTLEVSIWEAPPATLFGASSISSQNSSSSQVTVLPEQMVAADGTIQVPFAGRIVAAGKTLQQIQDAIVKELTGKALNYQVLIRIKNNESSNVTIVGEVNQSQSIPLTSKRRTLIRCFSVCWWVSSAC